MLQRTSIMWAHNNNNSIYCVHISVQIPTTLYPVQVMLKEQELEKIDKDRQKEINAKKCYDEWVTKKLALERERTNNQQRKIAEKEAEEKEVCE